MTTYSQLRRRQGQDSECSLSLEKKRELSKNLELKRILDLEHLQSLKDIPRSLCSYEIKIITAYSTNYNIGKLCESVNKRYALKHGYEFESTVLNYDDMINQVAPRKHCTWYKVKLIIGELQNSLKEAEISKKVITAPSSSSSSSSSKLESEDSKNTSIIKYLLWIDADAIFINHSFILEGFIQRGKYKNLIIAEDMNSCCLINAGVMLIRINEWSLDLWKNVYQCQTYFNKPFYDQSALIKILKSKQQGLSLIQPFHTYLPGALQGDKYFPHVTVLPHLDFNSNHGNVNLDNRKVLRKVNRSKEKLILRQQAFDRCTPNTNQIVEDMEESIATTKGITTAGATTTATTVSTTTAASNTTTTFITIATTTTTTSSITTTTIATTTTTTTRTTTTTSTNNTININDEIECSFDLFNSQQAIDMPSELSSSSAAASSQDTSSSSSSSSLDTPSSSSSCSVLPTANTINTINPSTGESESLQLLHPHALVDEEMQLLQSLLSFNHSNSNHNKHNNDNNSNDNHSNHTHTQFIFHAAGTCDKLISLQSVISKYGLADATE